MASTTVYSPMGAKAGEADGEIRISSSKGRCGTIVIVVLLALFLIVTTVLAAAFVALYVTKSDSDSSSSSSPNSSNSSTGSNVCQTEACFDVAVQILGAMDEDVDPCEDFYNFTCGNWALFHAIPPGIII